MGTHYALSIREIRHHPCLQKLTLTHMLHMEKENITMGQVVGTFAKV